MLQVPLPAEPFINPERSFLNNSYNCKIPVHLPISDIISCPVCMLTVSHPGVSFLIAGTLDHLAMSLAHSSPQWVQNKQFVSGSSSHSNSCSYQVLVSEVFPSLPWTYKSRTLLSSFVHLKTLCLQNRVVLSVLKFAHQLISTETKERYPENRIIQQWKWST